MLEHSLDTVDGLCADSRIEAIQTCKAPPAIERGGLFVAGRVVVVGGQKEANLD